MPAVQGLPTMMRPVPIAMPKLKQRKQKEGKATGSRNDDSVSRRCRRRILLGQGPCAWAECFASKETRHHDVGRSHLLKANLAGPVHCACNGATTWSETLSCAAWRRGSGMKDM